ncbi:MAG: hypothetical protein RLZZ584_46, partial [Pseudomonadota bacterium]
ELIAHIAVQYKIDHFRRHGRLVAANNDLFGPASWLAVHIGQHNWPERCDPLADLRGGDTADKMLERQRLAMVQAAESMPGHAEVHPPVLPRRDDITRIDRTYADSIHREALNNKCIQPAHFPPAA